MPSMQRKKTKIKSASIQNGKYYKMALTDITINTLSSNELENDTNLIFNIAFALQTSNSLNILPFVSSSFSLEKLPSDHTIST